SRMYGADRPCQWSPSLILRDLTESAVWRSSHAPPARARPARPSKWTSSPRRRPRPRPPPPHPSASRNVRERDARAPRPNRHDIPPASSAFPPRALWPLQPLQELDDRGVHLARPLLLSPVPAARQHDRPSEIRNKLAEIRDKLIHPAEVHDQVAITGDVERRHRHPGSCVGRH